MRTDIEQLLDAIRAETHAARQQQLGQYGSAFIDSDSSALTPPEGMIIIAIQFQGSCRLAGLVPEDASGSASFGTGTTGSGSGGVVVDTTNEFSSGTMIYGRWTSVTAHTTVGASNGIIVYFGY